MQCPPTKPGLNGKKFHLVLAAANTSCVSIPNLSNINASSLTKEILISRCAFSIDLAASATLSDEAIFCYKVDNYYSKESERGIIYNDETLNIDWKFPSKNLIISEKDKLQPTLKDADLFEPNFKLNA